MIPVQFSKQRSTLVNDPPNGASNVGGMVPLIPLQLWKISDKLPQLGTLLKNV